MLNFHSNQPIHFKRNVIRNLYDNRMKLSDNRFHTELETEIFELFKSNGYPVNFIRSSIDNNLTSSNFQTMNRKPRYIFIPYIGTASLIMSKHLKKLDPSTHVVFSGHNSNCNNFFTKLKDPVLTSERFVLVYNIPCSGCDVVYIGETIQHLKTRIRQHTNDVKNKRTKNSALVDHALNHHNNFNFDNTSISCYEENPVKRLIRESIEIKKNNKSVNFKTDLNSLSISFAHVISRLS